MIGIDMDSQRLIGKVEFFCEEAKRVCGGKSRRIMQMCKHCLDLVQLINEKVNDGADEKEIRLLKFELISVLVELLGLLSDVYGDNP